MFNSSKQRLVLSHSDTVSLPKLLSYLAAEVLLERDAYYAHVLIVSRLQISHSSTAELSVAGNGHE